MNRTQLSIECNQHWTPGSNSNFIVTLDSCIYSGWFYIVRLSANPGYSRLSKNIIIDWYLDTTDDESNSGEEHVTLALPFSKWLFVNSLINIQELCTTVWFQVNCKIKCCLTEYYTHFTLCITLPVICCTVTGALLFISNYVHKTLWKSCILCNCFWL